LAKHQRRHHQPAVGQRRRKPRLFLWVPAAVVVVVVLGVAINYWVSGARRPLNVLLITLDTTRADYLGCYGGTAAQTPNLDRVAREGALFRRCSTSTVMTLPSHCSIMTGLYPFVHGVRRNGVDHLPAAANTLAEVFKAAGFATAASVASYVLDPRFGLAQGFDVYHAVPPPQTGADQSSAERKGDRVCDDALELLRQRAKQRFFLWVHFYDPHYPYESPRHPDIESAAAYADEITFMDSQIGRLLAGLRELGLEQKTLVLLVGDHGEGLNDHQEYQHGFFVYETCARVPLLVRYPRVVPAGRQIDTVVRTVDLAPTILELVGLPSLRAASGISLTPLLVGRATDLQLRAYAESPEPYALLRLSPIRTLTVGPWKYIGSPSPQLFDLATDPGELNNVIAAHADTAATLREQLRALLADAPPRIPADKSAPLVSGEIARLESLGYLGLAVDPNAPDASGLDTVEPQGGDPHAYAGLMLTYEHARREIGYGRFAQAERELRDVLTTLSSAPAPLRDLAFVLARQGKRDEAAQVYEQTLSVVPADARARVEYANMLIEAQQWERAVAQAVEALRLAPNDFSAHAILGNAYTQLGRLDPAAAHLQAATRLQPQLAGPLQALGQVYYQQGRLTEAAECFRKARALDPQSAPEQRK
jgi:arylsulfatase A-like enzyme/Flp pilus assembly protein TadD